MKKILLIDDQRKPEWIQRAGSDSSDYARYTDEEVEVALNGQDGIEKLKEQRWDVLFLDHDMGSGNQNGMDVIRFLDANRELIPERVFLVTANIVERPKMLEYMRVWAKAGILKDWGWQ